MSNKIQNNSKLIMMDNNISDSERKKREEQIIENNKTSTNREDLKEKIHDIHNYLRNNGAGYGMNALKIFNIFYGLKKIEDNNLFEKLNLPEECRFSYLLNLVNSNEYSNEKLVEIIDEKILNDISKNEKIYFLFYEIRGGINGNVFKYLINRINDITIIEKTCNVLLSGKIYEYFIGRDESAISELGAYFTNRYIVDYILNKLKPKINLDGNIPTMIDMFGGSGGFTTGYIDYFNKNNRNINWNNNINNIYHFDMNEDVIKSAGLEFFCLTGEFPNMDNNLKYKNSFTDEFNNKKFQYILTNPPYGGDKICKTERSKKRDKIKEYIKTLLKEEKDSTVIEKRNNQLNKIKEEEKLEKKELNKTKVSLEYCSNRINIFAKNNNLKGNDKESCSLILIMDMLDEGGTAIGVLKEGVFFNKTYKDLRKCLIEKFNVREVISIPQDQFENTSTKTSIIIFDNIQEKTSKVKFSELIIEKYINDNFIEINDEIYIYENKDDIKEVTDKIISIAKKEEILANKIISLNGKDYSNNNIICNDEYELVKLGNICKFQPKSKRNASFGKALGKYNFYTSSEKIQKCDIADYNEECLIIGNGGIANIKIDNKFSCSDHNYVIKTKYNYYIYYLLLGKIELLSNGFTGSTLKNLSKDYLINIKIPIPKNKQFIQELEPIFQQIENLQNDVKNADLKYKKYINELSQEAIIKF